MAAPMKTDFEDWLSGKLLEINPDVDLEIFVSYIQGIFEDDMPEEEQKESLMGILSQIMEDDLEAMCDSVQNKWKVSAVSMKEQQEAAKQKEKENLDSKLANMMQNQNLSLAKTREVSEEEKARKAAILAQYAQQSDDEDNAGDPGGGDAQDKQGAAASALKQNTNAAMVEQREKEMRDAMKASHDTKKQKDKEDREKQKQKAQERKEAEKKRTQKGERRR